MKPASRQNIVAAKSLEHPGLIVRRDKMHPAVLIHATQSTDYRAVICEPNSVVWVASDTIRKSEFIRLIIKGHIPPAGVQTHLSSPRIFRRLPFIMQVCLSFGQDALDVWRRRRTVGLCDRPAFRDPRSDFLGLVHTVCWGQSRQWVIMQEATEVVALEDQPDGLIASGVPPGAADDDACAGHLAGAADEGDADGVQG